MKTIFYSLIGAAVLGVYLTSPVDLLANACPDTFHPVTNQDCDDDSDKGCGEDITKEPWFHHYSQYEDDKEDPTYKLEQDAAWPAEREEFSDELFR